MPKSFMKSILERSTVDTCCISPAPPVHRFGPFYPPEFRWMEDRAIDRVGIPNRFDKTIYQVIGAVEADEPVIRPVGRSK